MKDPLFTTSDLPVKDDVPPQKPGIFRRMGRAWLRFSGPNPDRFTSSLRSQEILRRSRILSVLLLLIFITLGVFGPVAILIPTVLIPLLAYVLISAIALMLNRAASVTMGGIFYVLGIDAALTILLVTLPHGLRNINLPDFDLFLISTLVGGIIFSRRLLPFVAVYHILLIVMLFIFLPHEHLLTLEIQSNGQGPYGEISDAILLQIAGTTIAWLNSWSIDRALLRASRAEDLAKAHRRLSEYMRLEIKLKERLEYGIQVLKEAHARFANGDYKARAILQDNELGSLALSFNLLAERLNRVAQIAADYTRLEQAVQQLFAIRDAVVYQGTLQPLVPTGTYVDQIYPWLKQFYQSRQICAYCSEGLEKVRQTLLRQKSSLIQLKSSLEQTQIDAQTMGAGTSIHSFTVAHLEKVQQFYQQVEEQGMRCLQEARQIEQLLKTAT